MMYTEVFNLPNEMPVLHNSKGDLMREKLNSLVHELTSVL
jgi:hypothetical protein